MKYKISKNYVEQGPYGVMQIRALLKSGELDAGFYVETVEKGWIPLPDFLEGLPRRKRQSQAREATENRRSPRERKSAKRKA